MAAKSAEGRASPALERLFREHAGKLREFLVRLSGPGLDPDDLLQEVFVVALRRSVDFPEGAPPAGWLFGTAVRVASSSRRNARLRRFFGLELASEHAGPTTPAALFESAEDSQKVYAILERLSEKKRAVFIMFELQGLTGPEIAELLGCPLKTVWSRLAHARQEFLEGLRRLEATEKERAQRGRQVRS
jgi:RNA polymerase sigma-70 factor (ECF subfamily)